VGKEKKAQGSEARSPAKKGPLIAKKDFEIQQNDYLRVIKAGEDLGDVPAVYHANLKTEGVL
jgi:hypothetical protein